MKVEAAQDGPIVVIDDDEAMRRACDAALRRTGYQVDTFADGPSGLKRIEEVRPGLIVVDLKMPGMGGLEILERVKQLDPDIVVIVITGFATVSTAVDAMKAGAYDFIPKPFTADELRVIIARGIERRRLTMEAKRLRQEKEAQTRKFITFVSHQLQAPLGAVQQYLDVLCHLSGDAIPAQQRQWIDRSGRKIADMLQTINDWLTISKVEGGQLATEREPIQWQNVAAEVLESSAAVAAVAQVNLRNELPADLPPVVGDATGLRMLLTNLVNNAVKYNRSGGTVRITADADSTAVRLSVVDTGVGIPHEEQERVFDEFYRGSAARAAGGGGTGMGLPICRKIAEELGGRITLTSRPGEGSNFTVALPRAGSGAASNDGPPKAGLP